MSRRRAGEKRPRSPLRRLLAAFAALLLPGHAVATDNAAVDRDWTTHPAIVELPAAHTLYALGDVHGDYERMAQLLAAATLIAPNPATPDAARWTGGDTTLVCIGDLIDKYDRALDAIALLRAIEPQARQAGGRVIVTLGNHEAAFLASAGADAKVAEFTAELKAAHLSPADVAAGRDPRGVGQWLRDLPVAARVGDWFLCHAGNTAGRTLADLSQAITTDVTAHGFGAPILADPNSLLEARLRPRPWWESDGSAIELKDKKKLKPDPAAAEQRLRQYVEALGCKHLVFGHQPGKVTFADGRTRDPGEMFTAFDGLGFLIDTGMSRAVQKDARPALLKVELHPNGMSASAVYSDGKKVELWSQGDPSAGRP